MDRIVELNGNHIFVYSYGQGPVTFVLLSGSGVPFPSLEYMSLAKALAKFSQVIGIEKLGYGHSDLGKGGRGIDNVVEDYRGVLEKLDIKAPVVLAAHSMGFLEALRWGQLYPTEIAGILGIDPATPECYKDFDIEGAAKGLKKELFGEPYLDQRGKEFKRYASAGGKKQSVSSGSDALLPVKRGRNNAGSGYLESSCFTVFK